MKYRYAITFIPGFTDVVRRALQRDIPDGELIEEEDGLFVIDTKAVPSRLRMVSYVNNIYFCLQLSLFSPEVSLEKRVKQISHDLPLDTVSGLWPFRDAQSFRMMVLQGSRLVHIPKSLAKRIQEHVINETGWEYSPLRADSEIWILARESGLTMATLKIEEAHVPVPTVAGELKPKLAELLILASRPLPDDRFLDPFAGYGSLAKARIRIGDYAEIRAYDKDADLVRSLRKQLGSAPRVITGQLDALRMRQLPDGSVSRIVTDPHWGVFTGQDLNYRKFYEDMLHEFARVLSRDGIAVILAGNPDEMEYAILRSRVFVIESSFTTLVSGKKATVFTLTKAGRF
ncbi:MAG: hypothetical protein N2691_04325 [Patescibacteria group bacterium]|nr:hypothetical protein [Patescibacteria group bacterium]